MTYPTPLAFTGLALAKTDPNNPAQAVRFAHDPVEPKQRHVWDGNCVQAMPLEVFNTRFEVTNAP